MRVGEIWIRKSYYDYDGSGAIIAIPIKVIHTYKTINGNIEDVWIFECFMRNGERYICPIAVSVLLNRLFKIGESK